MYRAKAAECDQHAASASDPTIKLQYRALARQWREMAEIADRLLK